MGSSLTLRRTQESIHLAVWQAIDSCGSPTFTILCITQSGSTFHICLTEFASGNTIEPPPDTILHTIFNAYDSLAHIVQFIGSSHLSILLHFLEEAGIIVEGTRQLMRISFVEISLEIIIPGERLVAVQGITTTETDTIQFLIRSDFLADIQKIKLRTFIPGSIIRLIEGRNALHGESFGLGILYGSLDHLVPLFRFALVVRCIERLMVTVDGHSSHS